MTNQEIALSAAVHYAPAYHDYFALADVARYAAQHLDISQAQAQTALSGLVRRRVIERVPGGRYRIAFDYRGFARRCAKSNRVPGYVNVEQITRYGDPNYLPQFADPLPHSTL